jgi:hypothetical protein
LHSLDWPAGGARSLGDEVEGRQRWHKPVWAGGRLLINPS